LPTDVFREASRPLAEEVRETSRLGYGSAGATGVRDDAVMRSRLTWGSAVPTLVCLLAVSAMCWAAFLPFVEITWGDCLACGPPAPPLTESLAQGSRGQLVLVMLVVLGIAASLHLAGIRRRIAAFVVLGASLIVVDAAVSWPGSFTGLGTPPPIDYGFYPFVFAAMVAAVAALVMVAMSFRGSRLSVDTRLHPTQI
jgi:hypothetical protein